MARRAARMRMRDCAPAHHPSIPLTSVPVLYSFARSGGTLVNQLLGVHPGCLVLSEVNPAGSCKPVAEQAVEWLGLLERAEEAKFSRLPYGRQIVELDRRARERGKRLFVRDWVTVNFLPGASADAVASGLLEQPMYLARAGLDSEPLVVTRRAGAVYRSIARTFYHLAGLGVDSFAPAYLRYAQAVSDFPSIAMESLRAQPEATVAAVLERFALDGSPVELLASFARFRNCTGNTTLRQPTESSSADRVLPPEEPGAPAQPLHPLLAEADALLGYER
jgi:hypothetical protein